MLDRLVAALGLARPSELSGLAAGGRVPVQRIAALAPVVVRAAHAGEPLAAAVVADAVRELTATVAGLRRRSGLHDAPVVVCGGLARALDLRLGRVVDDGVDGALRLVREQLP
jgi:N-acetylglucosamine kinase-like BadF-type ATPase